MSDWSNQQLVEEILQYSNMMEGETLARQPVFNIGITVDFGGVFNQKRMTLEKLLMILP